MADLPTLAMAFRNVEDIDDAFDLTYAGDPADFANAQFRCTLASATDPADVLDFVSDIGAPRRVACEIDCAEGIEMESFPGALGQVLSNLIQNALVHGFADERGGTMRLTARPLDDARVALDFSDDGAGVPADELPRIFDPFFTTKRQAGGTGLGLHVTWNLVVQKLGGSIRAESAPGCGLALHIELPRHAP